ncbi:Chitin elicitor receptor kinase 1 [Bienertia sinuspersici]
MDEAASAMVEVEFRIQIIWARVMDHKLDELYAQYGEVSPKVDVYAFGVVLYELISAKAAVVKQTASGPDSKGLVGMALEFIVITVSGYHIMNLRLLSISMTKMRFGNW